MPTRILVTGASGFIGKHLCEGLEERGIPFARLARVPGEWPDRLGETLDLSGHSAIVHLAVPRIRQADAWDEVRAQTLVPLEGMLTAIRRTNPDCLLVFVSSQSADPATASQYGRAKWESEKLLERSGLRYVIVRPGLVIGPGGAGLFPTILSVLRKSPIFPLVGRGDQLMQPVPVATVVAGLCELGGGGAGRRHDGRLYSIALAPVRFREFLAAVARRLGLRRAFVPVPVFLVDVGLWLLERLFRTPPLTRTNLEGLLALKTMEVEPSLAALGLQTPSLESSIDQALGLRSSRSAQSSLAAEEEGVALAQRLFGIELDRRTARRYSEASALLPPCERPDLARILDLGLDLEAIEYALRPTHPQLTQRIHALVYLLEFRPSFFERMTNTRDARAGAWLQLAGHVFRSVYLRLKGRALVRRYGLV